MEKEEILNELNKISAGDAVHVDADDNGNLIATVAGEKAKSVSVRVIDGFSNRQLSCRLIKDKQGKYDMQTAICLGKA